jgi:hypothetical protein
MQKDNATIRLKVSLRQNLLQYIVDPVIMETHGGYGSIFLRCYSKVKLGIVFEKDEKKTAELAKQRPTWSVYECECEHAILGGAGSHLPINLLDVDPYGQPWPVIDAFFASERDFQPRLGIVVNDGLRQSLQTKKAWSVGSMQEIVDKYGNDHVYENYLSICREIIEKKVGQRGYTLTHWAGYYCGYINQMTHYAAVMER